MVAMHWWDILPIIILVAIVVAAVTVWRVSRRQE